MRNLSRRVSVVASASVLALGLAACGGSSSSSSSPAAGSSSGSSTGSGGASVKMGFMGALTGPDAQLGINEYDGAKLAIDAYNATSPATKIDFIKYDTQGDPNQAASQANKVVTDKVVGIIGPAFSGESKQAVPILEEAKIPNISASATNATLSKNGWKTWHRVLANDDVQGPGVAKFITGALAAKKTAVIDDQSEYGKGLSDVVAKTITDGGATVSVRESIDPKGDDYSSTVNKIKAAGVDAIFYGGYYSSASKFVGQLRDAGVTAKFVSGDGTLDQKFIDGAKTQSVGAFLSCTCVLATASDDPAVQAFIDNFTKTFNLAPATYSAEGFDAATAFIKALQAGKTDSAGILDFLSTVDFKGVSKPIKFNANGELTTGSVYMHEVKDGKIIALGDYTTAKPQ